MTAWLNIRGASFLAAAILLGAVAVTAERTTAREGSETQVPIQSSTRPNILRRRIFSDETDENKSRRLREGTIVNDQSGYFREDGIGTTFVADSGWSFGALPNLNLERVIRLLKSTEDPGNVRWSVTGEVTEFTGRNYLLISRAVYKAATPPPVPDRVAAPKQP